LEYWISHCFYSVLTRCTMRMRVPECQFIFMRIWKWKMKFLVHFNFSFLLKIENDFSNLSFKIHFSFSRKNENANLTNSSISSGFQKTENRNFQIHFSIFKKKRKSKCFHEFNFCWSVTLGWKYLNTLITWRLYLLQTWLIEILPSTWSLFHEVIDGSKQNWDPMQFKINNK